MRWSIPVLLALSGACRKVEPIPADLDGLVRYLWEAVEEGDDDMLAEVVDALHDAVDGGRLEDPYEGEVSALSLAAIEPFGRDVDPRDATGVLLVNRIGCTVDEADAVLSYPHQDELFEGIYDRFERTLDGPRPAYLDGRDDDLEWDTVYATSVIGTAYTVESHTLLRRIPEGRSGQPAIFERLYLRDEAVFDNPESNSFLAQDYHLEAFWRDGGGVLHLYALWKDARLLGFEDESESAQRITLNKLRQADDQMTVLCEEGRP